MKPKTYYEILDINKNATQAEIKEAYKKFQAESEKDNRKTDFQDMSAAFEILLNVEQRRIYDASIEDNEQPHKSIPQAKQSAPSAVASNNASNNISSSTTFFDNSKACKLLIIGDSRVPKHELLKRFGLVEEKDTFSAVIGIDFKKRTVKIANKQVNLHLYDTVGLEHYRTLFHSYYRDASGIFLTFDYSNANTFQHLRTWYLHAKQNIPKNASIIMIGIENDSSFSVVSKKEVLALAAELSIPYHLVSLNDSNRTEEALSIMIKSITGHSHLQLVVQEPNPNSESVNNDHVLPEEDNQRGCSMM